MKFLLAIALCLGLAACQFQGPRPTVDQEPYVGPRVSIDSWAMRHQITLTTRTGGWSVELDQTRDGEGTRDVFISAYRPDPNQMVTQALTPHEIDSTVDSRTPISIYVRVIDQGADPADFPYRFAARSAVQR